MFMSLKLVFRGPMTSNETSNFKNPDYLQLMCLHCKFYFLIFIFTRNEVLKRLILICLISSIDIFCVWSLSHSLKTHEDHFMLVNMDCFVYIGFRFGLIFIEEVQSLVFEIKLILQ